ncbi:dynein light chain Tctex-type protein 2B-like isoform X2 [Phlebotomus papatasi]|uniref:dynein light chain Tctex-type protein 2B-like isoform X2 n=1 Tax=Phlebotomus papatasi TaxID=29031 RepID=UPI0024841B62|nr:dynein light chain Tctex-type protein 2B-like isoform X2 [Phlebotomus papatasi]
MEQVAEKSDAGTPVSNDKTYSKEDAAIWTKQISQEVGSKIMELKMKRYKHVVQVTLGQQLGAGCKYIARCRWDAESDSQVSNVFTNSSLFCIVTVFGVYLY